MDISSFLKVEEDGTLIQHPASRYTTRWEGMFTTEFVNGWQNPSTMEEVCKSIAAEMNSILAEE